MKRHLTLRTERLTDLTDQELRVTGGAGGVDETYTGRVDCILSIRGCFTNMFCSLLCNIES